MKKSRPGRPFYLLLAGLHSVFLIFLSFVLLNWQFVHWDEGEIIQFGPILKKLVLSWEEKPDKDRFMFINVSRDNSLIDINDEFGFPVGNEVITDRSKLAQFIQAINQSNNHSALLLDIRFDLPSPDDSVLQSALEKSQRTLISNHLTNGKSDSVVFKASYGISDYPIVSGGFFKFRYVYNDTIKTIPLLMDEIVNNKSYHKKGPFFTDGSAYYLNVFLSDLLIRSYDIFQAEDRYFYADLNSLLYLDSTSFSDLVKNRIIVVGDYERKDIHETLMGDMPGPVILINAFLTLERGLNRIQPAYILFLFLSYFLISFVLVYPGDPVERLISKISADNRLATLLANLLSYFFLLIMVVLIGYLVFDILINVLWLLFYLWLMDKLISTVHRKMGLESKKSIS